MKSPETRRFFSVFPLAQCENGVNVLCFFGLPAHPQERGFGITCRFTAKLMQFELHASSLAQVTFKALGAQYF